jgi:hypothetical protein
MLIKALFVNSALMHHRADFYVIFSLCWNYLLAANIKRATNHKGQSVE